MILCQFGRRTAAPLHLKRFLMRLLQFTVASIFLMAGVNKILDHGTLVHTLFRLKWLPDGLIYPAVTLLILLELGTGLLLLTGRTVRVAAAVGTLMSASFTGVTGFLIGQHAGSTCGCFGSLLPLAPPAMFGVDLLLLLSCLTLLDHHRLQVAHGIRSDDRTQ